MSSWRPFLAGAPQATSFSYLYQCLFQRIKIKLFADDTSVFTVVEDKSKSANVLNSHLQSISTFLIQILVNRLKKCHFQEKRKLKFIQP